MLFSTMLGHTADQILRNQAPSKIDWTF